MMNVYEAINNIKMNVRPDVDPQWFEVIYQRIDELQAENERLGEQLTDSDCQLVDALAEIDRLRKELASYRKGDCRRKIDKAMEGE